MGIRVREDKPFGLEFVQEFELWAWDMGMNAGSIFKALDPPLYGGFPKLGASVWGPNNKDYSILGSI